MMVGLNIRPCRIPKFQGQAEYLFSAEAELTSTTVKKAWSRPPISMDFQVHKEVIRRFCLRAVSC